LEDGEAYREKWRGVQREGKEGTMERNDRSPPNRDSQLAEERRHTLRRLTVRRRHERPEPDRRMDERRRPVTRLAFVPSVTSFTSVIMA
jgi:hypothetical protein